LTGGVNVEQRTLRKLLTADEYAQYLQEVEDAKAVAQYQREESEAFAKYNALLKRADFAYGRWDYFARNGKQRGKARMEAQYTALYERAYEHLSELLAAQPHLHDWLDRSFSDDAAHAPGLDKHSAPRVITSKSHQNSARSKYQTRNPQGVKTDAVAEALYRLKHVAQTENPRHEQTKVALRQFLKLPDEDNI
jgi:hypothetical protein